MKEALVKEFKLYKQNCLKNRNVCGFGRKKYLNYLDNLRLSIN